MGDEDPPDFEWWPDGALVSYVTECNCDWCRHLSGRLKMESDRDLPDVEPVGDDSEDPSPSEEPAAPDGVAPLTEFSTE